MKQLYYVITITLNLMMGLLYCWGAEHNRYICAWLWGIVPTINLILFGIFEKYIMEEQEV